MTQFDKYTKEYRSLAGKTDAVSEKRKAELLQWFQTHRTDENIEKAGGTLDTWVSEMEQELEDVRQEILREQMTDDIYKILPLSYIAKNYFGKSVSWLSQRINGSPVRGKAYTLNEQQKAIFTHAVHDIGNRFAAFQLS